VTTEGEVQATIETTTKINIDLKTAAEWFANLSA
jgi:hypothetical protein